MLRCTAGSTGAEGVAPPHFTLSLEHSTLNVPMLVFTSSVQPVPLRFPHLAQLAHQIAPMHRVSDLPTTIGCTDGGAISLTGAAKSATSRPICRGDLLDTSNIFYLWIFTILWHLHDGLDSTS